MPTMIDTPVHAKCCPAITAVKHLRYCCLEFFECSFDAIPGVFALWIESPCGIPVKVYGRAMHSGHSTPSEFFVLLAYERRQLLRKR